ncbi:uncharacterized protein LOC132546211 [Ylistrum balloti]|uniref:uncharacterized protein LOC132546211 n=1 Tax=Ylistrum balloti TaxID=509963 RepID=UPI002905B732|nr:uncharacterized protein LOC132546211 [Ylistrum balloti]
MSQWQVEPFSSTCEWKGNYWSSRPDGNGECTPCSSCPAGEFMRGRCTKTVNTRCAKCRHGYFSLGGFKKKCTKCRKTVCKPGYRYIRCRRYRNAGCVPCKKNYFYVEETGQCKRCNICKPGYYVSSMCGLYNDTVCKPCPEGTFLESSSLQLYCRACRFCRIGEQTIRPCTADHNTECGNCSPGYFRRQSSHECDRCSLCYREYPGHTIEVDECRTKQNDSDTICMPVPFPPYGYFNDDEYDYEVEMPVGTSAIDDISMAVGVMTGVIVVVLIGLGFSLVLFYLWKRRCRKEKEASKPLQMSPRDKVQQWISKQDSEEFFTKNINNSEPAIWTTSIGILKRNSYPSVLSVETDLESRHILRPLKHASSGNEEQEEFNMISVSGDDLPSADINGMASDLLCDHADVNKTTRLERGSERIGGIYTIEHHRTNDVVEESETADSKLNEAKDMKFSAVHDSSAIPKSTTVIANISAATGDFLYGKERKPLLTETEHSNKDVGVTSNKRTADLIQCELKSVRGDTSVPLPQATVVQTSLPRNGRSLECHTHKNLIGLESEYEGSSIVYSRNQNAAKAKRCNEESITYERGQERKWHSLDSALYGSFTAHPPGHIVQSSVVSKALSISEHNIKLYQEKCSCPDGYTEHTRDEKSCHRYKNCCLMSSL